MVINHHFAPPFGENIFGTCSNHLKQVQGEQEGRSKNYTGTSRLLMTCMKTPHGRMAAKLLEGAMDR